MADKRTASVRDIGDVGTKQVHREYRCIIYTRAKLFNRTGVGFCKFTAKDDVPHISLQHILTKAVTMAPLVFRDRKALTLNFVFAYLL